MRIDAQGTAGDANTVAEYLDNCLDPNIVVDFEQAVLSDNARLAEVAACHQILSSLLTEIESVPDSTKGALKIAVGERLESKVIALGADDSGTAAQSADSSRVMETSGFVSQSYKEKSVRGIDLSDASVGHVPDYLKSNHSHGWGSFLSTAALVAAVCVLAWVSLGSLESVKELFYPPVDIANLDVDKSGQAELNERIAVAEVEGGMETAVPPETIESTSTPTEELSGLNPTAIESNKIAGDSNAAVSDLPIEIELPVNSNVAGEPMTDEALSSVATADGSPMPLDPLTSVPTESRPEPELIWRPETKSASDAFLIAQKSSELGQTNLELVSAGESQQVGTRWLAPTGFRTDCWIAPGIRWKIADFTDLAVDNQMINDTVSVKLRVGRALVACTPNCQDFNLETADGKIRHIHFSDPNGIVAIEVRYEPFLGATVAEGLVGGLDNGGSLISMMNTIVNLTGVVGEATVSEDNITIEPLGVGETISWTGMNPLERGTLKSMPWWFKSATPLPADIETTKNMKQLLVAWKANQAAALNALPVPKPPAKANEKSNTSLHVFLNEIANKRSSSAYTLAMQLLLLSGDYSQFFGTAGVLSDPSLKSQRQLLIDNFEQSLGADPTREAILKQQLEAMDPARASRLLQLVSSPSDDQLERGVDRILVDAISSPYLDERVLGIHQLLRIIGRDLGYQPDRPTPDSVQAWKKLLNLNRIRWPKSRN
jgi:hypothetical protein